MSQSIPFDGDLDPVRHMPPTFLTKDLPSFIATLRGRVVGLRDQAHVALEEHGPLHPRTEDLAVEAWNCFNALNAADDHLRNIKTLAPMYRDLMDKLASAHEAMWKYVKGRKEFVINITEREVTNKELEDVVDGFKGYDKDLERLRRKFKADQIALKTKWDEIKAMSETDVEETGKAVEELAFKASAMLLNPNNHTLALIAGLYSVDPLIAEGIVWHVIDRFPKAADLSGLEQFLPFRRYNLDDAEVADDEVRYCADLWYRGFVY
jgi:hypothetical protein